jgi:hypothetical protein
MRHSPIALIMLLLTIALTGPVGMLPMSVGILAMYGLLRDVVQREKLSQGKERMAIRAVGLYGIAMLTFLVWLWSVKLDCSFQMGGAVWFGIIATLTHGLQIPARSKEAGAMRVSLGNQQTA